MLNKICDSKGKYDNKRPHNPGCGQKTRNRRQKVVVEKSNNADETGSREDKGHSDRDNREQKVHREVVKYENKPLYMLTECTHIY